MSIKKRREKTAETEEFGERRREKSRVEMGNRISMVRNRASRAIEERFTKPHRLVREPSNVDYKKLRKLILSEKLAPCFDGVEDSNPDLEECPICFFFYPSLNRSRCCMKGICTECFLQMKPSNAMDRPTQCPFCKYSSYAVEYRGAKTQEEKSLEQAEEQKVIEAKKRMQSQDVDRVTLADRISSDVEAQSAVPSFRALSSRSGDARHIRDSAVSLAGEGMEMARSPVVNDGNGRHEELDLDLEDVMITEAIWRSIQDLDPSCGPSGTTEPISSAHGSNQCGPSSAFINQGEASSAESVTGGLAVAIARMAERNIQRSELLQLIRENNNQTDQAIDGAIAIGAFTGPEPSGAQSEDGCSGSSSSTTEDDSWGSLAARILEENPSLESGFASDEDLVMDAADNESSSSSSVHSLSDPSSGSSDCSDDGAGASCSHPSAPFAVDRPLITVSNATA